MLAIGLIQGLQNYGLVVPDDVSIIGIDGLLIGDFVSARLTSVRPPVPEIARAMVAQIIRRLKDKEIKPAEHRLLPELVTRESVARH